MSAEIGRIRQFAARLLGDIQKLLNLNAQRAKAELADAGGPRDQTLVRHVYDIHMVRMHYDPSEVAILAREIMVADAVAYGHQFPAYREDPVAETVRAVNGLVADAGFADRYARFQRDMVYGEHVDFNTAIASVVALAAQVGNSRR